MIESEFTFNAEDMLIVVVEWFIVFGKEDEFLRYWSEREVISNRSCLIGEFLSRVRDTGEITLITLNPKSDCSTFLNVGLWRSYAAFEQQIGSKLTCGGKKMPFEHAPRGRIFLGPKRWRLGNSLLPTNYHPGVL